MTANQGWGLQDLAFGQAHDNSLNTASACSLTKMAKEQRITSGRTENDGDKSCSVFVWKSLRGAKYWIPTSGYYGRVLRLGFPGDKNLEPP